MESLIAGDLRLEPLTVAHADDMFDVLADPSIYTYLDHGPPPSRVHVRDVYARLEARRSPDGAQHWLNWVIREPSGALVGTVQATLVTKQRAWVAYVLASRYRGLGYGRTATRAMLDHLVAWYGIVECLATVEAANARSIALVEALGFHRATSARADEHAITASEMLFILTPLPAVLRINPIR